MLREAPTCAELHEFSSAGGIARPTALGDTGEPGSCPRGCAGASQLPAGCCRATEPAGRFRSLWAEMSHLWGQNHRITEWSGLEGTSVRHLVQPSAGEWRGGGGLGQWRTTEGLPVLGGTGTLEERVCSAGANAAMGRLRECSRILVLMQVMRAARPLPLAPGGEEARLGPWQVRCGAERRSGDLGTSLCVASTAFTVALGTSTTRTD